MVTRHTYRVFLSSPGDVTPERKIAFRVVQSINADMGYDAFDIFRWEEEFYTADGTFQDQIMPSQDCDLVLCVFWKHLGSDLPEHYRRADGLLPTGTEFEFESAIARSLESPDGVPDVIAYRKTAKKAYDEDNLRLQEAQRARLDAFWSRWFQNESGHFVAAFHAFETPGEFARDLDKHLRLWLSRREKNVAWQGGSPFRGLKPFDVDDHDVFFGRDREVARTRARFLANAVAGTRFLMVTGASGAGKSSILRAGVLPRLMRTQAAPGLPAFGRYAILRPAEIAADWAQGLASAISGPDALGPDLADGDYDSPEALAVALNAGPKAATIPIAKALQRARGETEANVALTLLIDQFEEVFAWSGDSRAAFIDVLIALSETTETYILASMRSEYLGRAAEDPALARLCELNRLASGGGRLISLDAPSPADLRAMILEPSALAGLTFDDGLAEQIEADATPEALPALQLALTELYAARDGTSLTQSAYDAFGGVAGIIAAQGEKAIAAAPPDARQAFAPLVRKLVFTPDLQGTTVSRPVRLSDLGDAEQTLVRVLVDHGLLVSDRDQIRLVHEALIAGWSRLSDIVLEEQTLLRIRHRLSLLAARHADAGRAGLLQGQLLQEGRHLAKSWSADAVASEEPRLPAFIAASDRAARRRTSVRVAALAASVLLVVGAGLQGLRMRHDIQRASLSAELAQSTAKAAEASLARDNPALALREIRRARELDPGHQSLSLAWRVLLSADDPQLAEIARGPFADIHFSGEGKLATLTPGGTLSTGDATRHFDIGRVLMARPLPDGQTLLVGAEGDVHLATADGRVEIVARASGPLTPEQVSLAPLPTGFALARARTLPSGDVSGPVEVLRCTPSCESLAHGPSGLWVNAVTLSQDGTRIAIAGQDPASGAPTILQGPVASDLTPLSGPIPDARQLRFAGTDLLVSALGDGAPTLYRSTRGAPPERLAATNGLRFGFDTSSNRLAYACGTRGLCLADVTRDGLKPVAKLKTLRAPLAAVAMDPATRQVAALLADGGLQRWSLDAKSDAFALWPLSDHPIVALDAGPDGAIAALDETRRLFRITDRVNDIARLPGTSTRDPHLAILGDGRIAVADGSQTITLMDPETGQYATHQLDWPASRVSPFEKLDFATSGLNEVVYASQALPFQRFGSGSVRIGGLTTHDDLVFVSTTDGALHRMERGSDSVTLAVARDASADRLAAMSLDTSPDARFLAATRSDDLVHIHDLEKGRVASSLRLPTQDSKVVAFSPDGAHLAVLTSAGGLGLWRVDADGAAQDVFFIDPVPPDLRDAGPATRIRPATWLTWRDATSIAVATADGDVIVLDIRPDRLDAALLQLDQLYQSLSP